MGVIHRLQLTLLNQAILAFNTGLASGVTIGNVPVAVVGSRLADHTILAGGSCVPHPSMTVTQGSAVTVGGSPLYQGATVSCLYN